MLRTDQVVIGVEEDAKLRMKALVAGQSGLQNEGLEEPARVREVPLDRARVGHGLQRAVLRREWASQPLGRPTHVLEPLREAGPRGDGPGHDRPRREIAPCRELAACCWLAPRRELA